MKLLFDHNLSPRLVTLLADLFPDSNHVHWLGLSAVQDAFVREYARDNGFIIVTKDADFSDLCLLYGFPPKVVWIRRGNCKTGDIEILLRSRFEDLEVLSNDNVMGVLTLF